MFSGGRLRRQSAAQTVDSEFRPFPCVPPTQGDDQGKADAAAVAAAVPPIAAAAFAFRGGGCSHLDLRLDIEPWTPSSGRRIPWVPTGSSPEWYPMYRKILEAGKSVQAIQVTPEEVLPLLDAVGGKGMYITAPLHDEAHAEQLAKAVEPYR